MDIKSCLRKREIKMGDILMKGIMLCRVSKNKIHCFYFLSFFPFYILRKWLHNLFLVNCQMIYTISHQFRSNFEFVYSHGCSTASPSQYVNEENIITVHNIWQYRFLLLLLGIIIMVAWCTWTIRNWHWMFIFFMNMMKQP